MKKILQLVLLIATAFYSTLSIQAQNTTSCNELINYVRANGTKKGEIKESEIYNSSWLKKVEGYSIDGNMVVVAKISSKGNNISSKEYIFCGIPSLNWDFFYGGRYQVGLSLGEKFHKYIFDYQCNCE